MRILLVLLGMGGIGVVIFVLSLEVRLPSVVDLQSHYHPLQVTRVLARDATPLAELFVERRTVVQLASIPAHVKLAVLAAEDAGFYEHEGLNYMGIVRALIVNFRSRQARQGGSTITQQVVKNVLLGSERTYRRKIREALLARRLERELSKDKILEIYLNHIYFGRGRYGIEEAARDLFGKSANQLTIAEGALLAGLIASPESYSPRRNLTAALARRDFVLRQMREKGFLTDIQFEVAERETIHIVSSSDARAGLAPEVVEIARKVLHRLEPERSQRGGFVITTTIDPALQAAARKIIREQLMAYDRRHGVMTSLKKPGKWCGKKHCSPGRMEKGETDFFPRFEAHKIWTGKVTGTDDINGFLYVQVGSVQGTVDIRHDERYNRDHLLPSQLASVGASVRVSLLAPAQGDTDGGEEKVPLKLELGPQASLVAIDVRTRQVVALIGSYEGMPGGFDRAIQSRRQPGSAFKPILYSYALHTREWTPSSLLEVVPRVFEGGYAPRNYEGWLGEDPLRLREVLAHSINVGAVYVMEQVGPAYVVPWAQSLGIRSPMKPDLSLALGSYEVQPLELANAYATFASGGIYREAQLIARIQGPDGEEIPLDPLPPPRRVLEEAEAYLITDLLTSVVDHGTGVRAKQLKRPIALKTGTSNGPKDVWAAGYSTDIAAVVWLGYDDGKSLGRETGATGALPAWVEWMRTAHEHSPASEFPRPPGLVQIAIDRKTGKLPISENAETLEEIFLAGTEPTEVAEPQPTQKEDVASL
ncbi:hypothetical protein BCY86_08085 [Pajaroellobacter abortibovis]|uniref:Uncharacterized protein n=2 Tax=Pajaroellobacter abortibovis TaxID=1882918 RepID=A0A1L6MZ23_9BACT|nr:hypothetical protein BCY86_08085 [Pajaroellobacter abortibovis]